MQILYTVLAGIATALVGAFIVACTATTLDGLKSIKTIERALVLAIFYVTLYTVLIVLLTLRL